MKPIYLDFNATTPISREVADAMVPYLYHHFGNPSSSYRYGVESKLAIEKARSQVANLIGSKNNEIIFTSGGTESNNMALKGIASAQPSRGNHIVTSQIEHPAIIEVCRWLEQQGFRMTYLPVDKFGLVSPTDLEKCIRKDTILVSVMHANNEVGTIQPITRLAEIAHRHGALFHADAAQSIGKIPVDVASLGVDLLTIAGHKLYAPKGVGALYVREGIELSLIIHGAGQEDGRRPGTENVLLNVGLGMACDIAKRDLADNQAHFLEMRNLLQQGLEQQLNPDNVQFNGHPESRLPNTLSISFRGVEATTLLAEISERVAASAGAACHSDQIEVSSVLSAMKVPLDWAMGTIRLSVGRSTTAEAIDEAAEVISHAVSRLQPQVNATSPNLETAEDGRDYRLMQYTQGLGCACKIGPAVLDKVLSSLPAPDDARLEVGWSSKDDAIVYRISSDAALVQTVDLFTPVVDDPYMFGAIAIANALSDIYAMGATPLFGLNIIGFPVRRLPDEVLQKVLQGASDKAKEAGVSLVGGHTFEDAEPKCGLAVTGLIEPDIAIRNDTAQPGDALVLTKRIGVGIIATAAKQGLADQSTIDSSTALMATLNRQSSQIMRKYGATACTDVSGFGLLGHLGEMAVGSLVDVKLSAQSIPVIAEALSFAEASIYSGGTKRNLDYVSSFVRFHPTIGEALQLVLADAQTSGGLLISLPASRAKALVDDLVASGISDASIIGEVISAGTGRVDVNH